MMVPDSGACAVCKLHPDSTRLFDLTDPVTYRLLREKASSQPVNRWRGRTAYELHVEGIQNEDYLEEDLIWLLRRFVLFEPPTSSAKSEGPSVDSYRQWAMLHLRDVWDRSWRPVIGVAPFARTSPEVQHPDQIVRRR